MSRTLGDDFEDDGPGLGSLDLEKGSQTGGMGGGASSYDGGNMDFEDPFAEEATGGPLELDLPSGSATAMRSGAPPAGGRSAPPQPPTAPPPGGRSAPPQGPPVPNLSFGPPPGMPPPAPVSSSQRSIPPVVPSSQRSLAPPHDSSPHVSSPPSSHPGFPAGSHAPTPMPSSRPTAAATMIAKYPDPPEQIWRAPKYALQVLWRQFELRNDLESLRRRRSPDVPLYEAALQAYDPRTFKLGLAIDVAILVVCTVLFFMPVILRFVRAD